MAVEPGDQYLKEAFVEHQPQTQELLQQFTGFIEANPNSFLFNPYDARAAHMTIPEDFKYTLGDLCLGSLGTEFGHDGASTLTRLTSGEFTDTWDMLVASGKNQDRRKQFVDAIKKVKELEAYLRAIIGALEILASQYESKWQEKVDKIKAKRTASQSGTGEAPTRDEEEEARALDHTLGIIKDDLKRLQTEEFKRGLQILGLVAEKAEEYRQSKGWGMGADEIGAPAPQPNPETPPEQTPE